MPQQKVKTVYFEVHIDIPDLGNDYIEKVRSRVYEEIDTIMYEVSADYGVAWSVKDKGVG